MAIMKLCPIAAAALAVVAASHAAGQTREQVEFGFSVRLPDRRPACENLSGDHPHGWGVPLEGDCKRAVRSLAILAGYNASFFGSPALAAYCDPSATRKGAKLGLRFPVTASATCLSTQPNGSVLVTVATQAGHWPDPQPDDPAEFRTPWINYYAYLTTTRSHFAADLAVFKDVLASVRISPPRQ